MQTTTQRATERAAAAAAADSDQEPGPADQEGRKRARGYLDLWERQLVMTALDGPRRSWLNRRDG